MLPPAKSEIKGILQELKGNLQDSSFAELLVETSQARLSGSFRFSQDEKKAVVYLRDGDVIFAVSNLRKHRLFEILLSKNILNKEILVEIPNFTNDLELSQALLSKKILEQQTIDKLFAYQVSDILKTVLLWQSGNWVYNHLARAKGDINFQIDITPLLLSYARSLPVETVIKRFKSFEEKFVSREIFSVNLDLTPPEAYIFSRLTTTPTRIQDIKNMCGLSDSETLKTLYTLWLGNLIARKNWSSVFSETRIRDILSVKLTLVKEAAVVSTQTSAVAPNNVTPATETVIEPEEVELEILEEEINEQKALEEYLENVEKAASYYEILGVNIEAQTSDIKTAYFQLAKKYHPDKFHQESNEGLQQRIQSAFTEIARAYDTLKDKDTREVYDYKLRKYLETVKDQPTSAVHTPQQPETNVEKAREEFDQGFGYLMQENYDTALPFLTRAVQLSPDNARFHAYFGKVLSFVGNQRHKAEQEIQTAIKLDADNPSFRIMLAEFYIQFNLLKRAEGELQRMLVQFPNNREAETLLDSLANK